MFVIFFKKKFQSARCACQFASQAAPSLVTVAIAYAETELICAFKWDASDLVKTLKTDELLGRRTSLGMGTATNVLANNNFSNSSAGGSPVEGSFEAVLNAQAMGKAARA